MSTLLHVTAVCCLVQCTFMHVHAWIRQCALDHPHRIAFTSLASALSTCMCRWADAGHARDTMCASKNIWPSAPLLHDLVSQQHARNRTGEAAFDWINIQFVWQLHMQQATYFKFNNNMYTTAHAFCSVSLVVLTKHARRDALHCIAKSAQNNSSASWTHELLQSNLLEELHHCISIHKQRKWSVLLASDELNAAFVLPYTWDSTALHHSNMRSAS